MFNTVLPPTIIEKITVVIVKGKTSKSELEVNEKIDSNVVSNTIIEIVPHLLIANFEKESDRIDSAAI
ncbi:hypothetical protein GCM10027592_13200 [Spirosoma flavus]